MTRKTAPRLPSVPLVAHDPYFSIWCPADNLTDVWATHWTGASNGLTGLIRIDGRTFRFCGASPEWPPLPQTGCEVLPTRTIYRFEGAGVQLEVVFLTPALLHRLDVLARPVTYVCLAVTSLDGRAHQAQAMFGAGANLCTEQGWQPVTWGRTRVPGLEALYFAAPGAPLNHAGDNTRIDWGRAVLAAPTGAGSAFGAGDALRAAFARDGKLPDADGDFDMPRGANRDWMLMAAAFALDAPACGAAAEAHCLLAYDDVWAIEWLQRRLPAYWRLGGVTFPAMLAAAERDFPALRAECAAYDEKWMKALTAAGGEDYAWLCAAAFRQAIAAHKLTADVDGTPLFFSKENFSNGCIATVDVTYPSAPLFLLAQPALLKGMLIPILEYALTPRWRFRYAPHDLGTYPLANGQVYGGGETSDERQMPVEECGNMLILMAALLRFNDDEGFCRRYYPLLRQWGEYLIERGYDPENQLCTDDFAGHMAHNANLSLKAIMALGGFAQIAARLGEEGDGRRFWAAAAEAAKRWANDARDGGHYRLAFDQPGTWSQKYNLVWDKLLGLGLFPESVAKDEMAFYRTKMERYGLPLDSRRTYTKLDWTVWSACLTGDDGDFAALTAPLAKWLAETPTRVPMTDWFETTDGKQSGFQARSVVGGLFIKLLYDEGARKELGAKG